jgi:hypothetical protein
MSDATSPFTAPNTEAFKAGYEKLQATFADLSGHNKATFEAFGESAKISAAGLKSASEISLAYSKAAAEAAAATAKTLGTAKSLHEVVEIQADYAKSAMASYFAEFTKVSDVLLGSMKDSVKPISERLSATMSAMQSAR